MTNAKYPIVTGMVIALMGNAIACAATKESIARKWTVPIPPAPATVSARTARVFVKRGGKDPIAVKWTRRHFSVCRTAADMETSILKLRHASASQCGLAMTVRKVTTLIDISRSAGILRRSINYEV